MSPGTISDLGLGRVFSLRKHQKWQRVPGSVLCSSENSWARNFLRDLVRKS